MKNKIQEDIQRAKDIIQKEKEEMKISSQKLKKNKTLRYNYDFTKLILFYFHVLIIYRTTKTH